MNYIILKFDKTLFALSGNDFGFETYVTQIKSKINMKEKNTLVFDDNIKIVGISFVKGLFSELLKNYDVDYIKEVINIKCKNKNLENEIWEALEF